MVRWLITYQVWNEHGLQGTGWVETNSHPIDWLRARPDHVAIFALKLQPEDPSMLEQPTGDDGL